MLSPAEIATLIAICTPWAEARLAGALIHAGSEGRPTLLIDNEGKEFELSRAESHRLLLQMNNAGTMIRFAGLAQVPLKVFSTTEKPIDTVLDNCTNLHIGYSLWLQAYEKASRLRSAPWQRLAVAFNIYRTGLPELETEYSSRAINYLKSGAIGTAAHAGEATHSAVIRDWAAGQALHHRAMIGRLQTSAHDNNKNASRNSGD